MSTQRKLNEKLFLSLQLSDGTASLPKRVFVDVRDSLGVLLHTGVELTSVGGGEFKEDTLLMPNQAVITAHYSVFESDGVTPDLTYSIGKDVYMRDFSAELIDSSISGGITITSSFASVDLVGNLTEGETLTADIAADDYLTANIEEINLSGELHEC